MRRGDILQSCFLLSILLPGILYSVDFRYNIQHVNEQTARLLFIWRRLMCACAVRDDTKRNVLLSLSKLQGCNLEVGMEKFEVRQGKLKQRR